MLNKLSQVTVLLVLFLTTTAFANGILIPTEKGVAPLSIKYQTVDINITSNVANTKVVQEFYNNTNRRLETNYVFPLPDGASISDFAMYINGKRMSGELVEKKKAKAIYESIVRKMKDPGLLEYMGNNLFRARIFPIEPHSTQKVELEYSEIISFDNNIYSYKYPLKTGMRAARTLEDFTVSVNLKSTVAIKNIYSPSHEIGISRKGDYHAVIGFEKNRVLLDKDFQLFYTVSEEDIGINLFTYKTKGEDGYFMLMLAPKTDLKKGEVNKKNIVFTIDTSGSMAGQKMRNAINALTFGINNLNEQDMFNIVRFSTDVELFKKGMAPVSHRNKVELFSTGLIQANKKNVAAAIEYTKEMRANGGTAIDYALTESLKLFNSSEGTNILVFMTDGLPTVGTRNIRNIMDNAKKGNVNRTRVFSFGVGHDVNTVLLDGIAKDGLGMSEYLKANEEIEIKLSHFFRKVANPVLSNISIDFGDVSVSKYYPRETPDIFKGDDLVIMGRYKGDGATAIRLKGTINGKDREYVYEGTFTAGDIERDFIPRLWAVRRVGYLLEEIKLHGEAKELKDEVITLSKQYGIMTPYTSYLVLENEKQYVQHGIKRQQQAKVRRQSKVVGGSAGSGRSNIPSESITKPKPKKGEGWFSNLFSKKAPTASAPAPRVDSKMSRVEERNGSVAMDYIVSDSPPEREALEAPASSSEGARYGGYRRRDYGAMKSVMDEDNLRVESGQKAVDLSKDIRKMKELKVTGDDQIVMSTKVIKGRTFNFKDGYWTDSGVKENLKGLKIKYLSDAYFNLLKAFPELKDALAIGEKIKLVINGKLLIIDEDGIEEKSIDELKAFYKK